MSELVSTHTDDTFHKKEIGARGVARTDTSLLVMNRLNQNEFTIFFSAVYSLPPKDLALGTYVTLSLPMQFKFEYPLIL